MKTLLECLTDYDTTLLRAIAERRGIELETGVQRDMAKELATALMSPDSLAETLAWLDERERRALDTLLVGGGRERLLRFTQQFGEIRRFGPGALAREAPWRAPVGPAESLWYQGLIARSFAEVSGVSVEFVFIPSDLLLLLPPPQTGQPLFQVPEMPLPHDTKQGDSALVDDLCMLLALVQNEQVRTRQDQLPAEWKTQLQAQCLDPQPERLGFLYHLARTLHLLDWRGRSLALHRERVRDWFRQSRVEQLRALQQVWRKDTVWNDLWHVPGLLCEDTGWRNDPLLARQAVLDLLRRCPTGRWLSISGFVEAVQAQFPDFLRPDGDFESWYIRDRRTGEYLQGLAYWERVEGALLAFFFEGPLHWLGVLSLGYKEGWRKPTAIRVTAWGADFLDLPHAPLEEPAAGPAPISPDGEVRLGRYNALFDRFQLARIAEWRASGQEYVYVLTPSSLRHAFGDDIRTGRIEKFLQRIAQDHVPAALIARIRSWASRYGQVSLQRVVVLETKTPQVMGELRAHKRIHVYLRDALSPTIALVRESDRQLLLQELERAGYLAEIIES